MKKEARRRRGVANHSGRQPVAAFAKNAGQAAPHALMCRETGDIPAFERDLAGDDRTAARPARQRIDQCRFAGAVGADEAHHLAGRHVDRDIRQRNVAGIAHAEMFASQHGAHSSRPR